METFWDRLPYLLLLVLPPVAVVCLAYWMKWAGQKALDRIVEEATARSHTDPSPPVDLSFCAYHCWIIFWTQSHYRARLPYDTAVILLRRLHYFTLRWGWLGPAAIVIPWSLLTYPIEKWRLRRQLAKSPPATDETTGSAVVSVKETQIHNL
jgi:hypothetical protein